MVDHRFFDKAQPIALGEIAQLTGATLSHIERANELIATIAPLDTATSGELSFLDNVKYIEKFCTSSASACFVREKFAHRAPAGMALLITEHPYTAFAKISATLYPARNIKALIHPTAIIEAGAELGTDVTIGAYSVIGAGVVIGDGTQIGAQCNVAYAIIGKRCILHPGARIGQDGFGFAPTATDLMKVPQLGRVIIGDDVEIGANSCIDRGSGPDTIIGNGTKIDNLVQIGHNVVIGKYTVIAAQTGISGSTIIGDGVMLGGQVGASGHITIGNGAKVAAQSGLLADIPAGATYGGYPAIPVRDWHRQTVALSKLIKPQTSPKNE